MADLILGTQGSGKSYYAVKKIVDNQSSYSAIFTNIADFKYQDNIKELVPQTFFATVVTPLWAKFRENNNISDIEQKKYFFELLKVPYFKNAKILIVIDEAHNFLGKKNEVVQWFMTYHRHLNVDYFLITQLLSSITTDNRIFNNIFEAYPVSRQFLPNRIRYKHYLALPLVEGNLAKNFSLKKEQKYFDMYHSGDIVITDSSNLKKNIFYFVILLVAIIAGFSYFIGHFGDSSIPKATKAVHVSPVLKKVVDEKKEFDEQNTKIYTYFVDLEKKSFFCADSLLVLPLALVPKPIYYTQHGYGFARFFYREEIQACVVEQKKDNKKSK